MAQNWFIPVHNGITIGYGPEVAGISNALAGALAGYATGDEYKEGKEAYERKLEQMRGENPGVTAVLEAGGVLIPSTAIAKLVRNGLGVAQVLRERKALERAYKEVKNNPFEGSSEDVLVELHPNGEKFYIQRGGIVKDHETGEIVVSGKRLRELTEGKHYGNFGLTKTIFKHNTTQDKIKEIPKILRNEKNVSKQGKKIVYKTTDSKGNVYRQVWGEDKNGNKRFITYFKED